MINGKGLVESLKPVSADDLLGRDKVDLDLEEVDRTYAGKCVMVTGAGGSIGSELCRQLILCGIRKLVLFEHSELALYSIERELQPDTEKLGIELATVLGSVTDAQRVESALRTHKIQGLLHAAAYKHVPLVEANEISGLRNNVIGTRILADAALRVGIERFVLISTDKAVRPTNVMGASKRLAELVIQDFASRSKKTLFSMVRFGNVLGSSGSVIPLFREQIEKGGPVTLTHGDVTRYFMTIPEAARLVLLAGSYARGGDVFVLDMGKPTKIYDLACSMIELSGRTVRNADNPEGDIEVKVTGLRPGEKLYEELLIGNDMLTTPHAKILRAQESSLSEIEIANALRDLSTSFEKDDVALARGVIERWVEGYQRPQTNRA
jgi:FlaA1/EpsC-like NDP-sugar epimerase